MKITLAATAVVLAVAGCGSTGSSSHGDTGLKPCSQVLAVGAPVQEDGVTCRAADGSMDVEASATIKCDNGKTLVKVSNLTGFVGGTWTRADLSC